MAGFTIASSTPSVRLDGSRRAQVAMTVTNTARRNLTARATVKVEQPAQAGWFTVADAQRDSPVDSTQQFTVQVAIPASAPVGTYRFQLNVVGVENPDEFSGEGPWTSVEIPAVQDPRHSRLLPILIGVWVVILLAVGGVVAYLVFGRQAPAQANLQVKATGLAFPTAQIGQPSTQFATVTLTNSGKAAAKVTDSFGGANAAEFKSQIDTCSGQSLTPGAQCYLVITFQPAIPVGAKSASLAFTTTSGPAPAPLALTGSANGIAAVSFSPTALSIGMLLSAQGTGTLTITNSGSGNLVISQVRLTDTTQGFTIVASNCQGVTHPPGGQCQVVVQFNFAGVGTRATTLLVVDNLAGGAQQVAVSGTRCGTKCIVVQRPFPILFPTP